MLFFGMLFMGLGVLGMVAGIGQATVASVVAAGSVSSGAVFAVISGLVFVSGTVLLTGGAMKNELAKLRRGLAIVVSESTERAQRKKTTHSAARTEAVARTAPAADDEEPRRRIAVGGQRETSADRAEPVLGTATAERLGAPGPRAVR